MNLKKIFRKIHTTGFARIRSRRRSPIADLAALPGFDPHYYIANNPDIHGSKISPVEHFLKYGWKEGRDPSAEFSTTQYLLENPDVARAHINPLVHFMNHGLAEGRGGWKKQVSSKSTDELMWAITQIHRMIVGRDIGINEAESRSMELEKDLKALVRFIEEDLIQRRIFCEASKAITSTGRVASSRNPLLISDLTNHGTAIENGIAHKNPSELQSKAHHRRRAILKMMEERNAFDSTGASTVREYHNITSSLRTRAYSGALRLSIVPEDIVTAPDTIQSIPRGNYNRNALERTASLLRLATQPV